MRNGAYQPDGRGGYVALDGGQAVLQRVLFLLTARRGGFPLLPRVGSRLYRLPRERAGSRPALARQYAAEALAELEGISVAGVELSDRADGRMDVTVLLDWNGQRLEAGLMV